MLKMRKKEIIIAKQMERRQQQELIRQQREEERARKADELRLKEEEAAQKKLLEKTRKETIFQMYIDKKKQLQDECQAGYLGSQSLIHAKRFHSTNRLKQVSKPVEQFDQASVVSDRSTANQGGYATLPHNHHMAKSKFKTAIYSIFRWGSHLTLGSIEANYNTSQSKYITLHLESRLSS